MDTFVMPLSEDRGVAAPVACGGGAAGAAPCPLRNRENMGCLLSLAAAAAAIACFLAGLTRNYATAGAIVQSRGSCGACLTVASSPLVIPRSCHRAWSFPALPRLVPGSVMSVGLPDADVDCSRAVSIPGAAIANCGPLRAAVALVDAGILKFAIQNALISGVGGRALAEPERPTAPPLR